MLAFFSNPRYIAAHAKGSEHPNPARGPDVLEETRVQVRSARKFALKGEWQRRNDRKSIGASSQRLEPLLGEPASEHGSGIVGDIGERSDAHPVCESESNSTLPMALPFIDYFGG